jgi:hypothetical protein
MASSGCCWVLFELAVELSSDVALEAALAADRDVVQGAVEVAASARLSR